MKVSGQNRPAAPSDQLSAGEEDLLAQIMRSSGSSVLAVAPEGPSTLALEALGTGFASLPHHAISTGRGERPPTFQLSP